MIAWTIVPPEPGLEELLTEIVHRIKAIEAELKELKE